MRSVAGRSPTISQGFRTVRSRSRVKSAEVPLAGLGSVVPGLGSVVPRLGGRTVRLGGQVPVIGDPVPSIASRRFATRVDVIARH